jgi:hypothetical protein
MAMRAFNAILVATAIAAGVPASVVHADMGRASGSNPSYIGVSVTGEVPGFTSDQLVAYLANQMQQEAGGAQQFAPVAPKSAAADRVSWSFKKLRLVWRGATHKGFPAQANWATYVSAEVKLYLHDTYQITVLLQPTIVTGSERDAVSAMAREAIRAISPAIEEDSHQAPRRGGP